MTYLRCHLTYQSACVNTGSEVMVYRQQMASFCNSLCLTHSTIKAFRHDHPLERMNSFKHCQPESYCITDANLDTLDTKDLECSHIEKSKGQNRLAQTKTVFVNRKISTNFCFHGFYRNTKDKTIKLNSCFCFQSEKEQVM